MRSAFLGSFPDPIGVVVDAIVVLVGPVSSETSLLIAAHVCLNKQLACVFVSNHQLASYINIRISLLKM